MYFWMMLVPKQPPLRLKSDTCVASDDTGLMTWSPTCFGDLAKECSDNFDFVCDVTTGWYHGLKGQLTLSQCGGDALCHEFRFITGTPPDCSPGAACDQCKKERQCTHAAHGTGHTKADTGVSASRSKEMHQADCKQVSGSVSCAFWGMRHGSDCVKAAPNCDLVAFCSILYKFIAIVRIFL